MSDQSRGPYIPKPGDISLFTNNYKTEERHPLLVGKVILNPKELEEFTDESGNVTLKIALWGKKMKDGKPFWAGKCEPDQGRENVNTTDALPAETEGETRPPDQLDDLPF